MKVSECLPCFSSLVLAFPLNKLSDDSCQGNKENETAHPIFVNGDQIYSSTNGSHPDKKSKCHPEKSIALISFENSSN